MAARFWRWLTCYRPIREAQASLRFSAGTGLGMSARQRRQAQDTVRRALARYKP